MTPTAFNLQVTPGAVPELELDGEPVEVVSVNVLAEAGQVPQLHVQLPAGAATIEGVAVVTQVAVGSAGDLVRSMDPGQVQRAALNRMGIGDSDLTPHILAVIAQQLDLEA